MHADLGCIAERRPSDHDATLVEKISATGLRQDCAANRNSAMVRIARATDWVWGQMIQVSVLGIALAVGTMLDAPPDTANLEDCTKERDREVQLSVCTEAICAGFHLSRELAHAYNSRGLAHSELGDQRRAIEDFDQAVKINPGLATAYVNRGLVREKSGEPERAIADYDEAIELDPDLARAYHNRGVAYLRLGRHARAIRDYDEALRIDPAHAIAYFSYANAHTRWNCSRRCRRPTWNAIR